MEKAKERKKRAHPISALFSRASVRQTPRNCVFVLFVCVVCANDYTSVVCCVPARHATVSALPCFTSASLSQHKRCGLACVRACARERHRRFSCSVALIDRHTKAKARSRIRCAEETLMSDSTRHVHTHTHTHRADDCFFVLKLCWIFFTRRCLLS